MVKAELAKHRTVVGQWESIQSSCESTKTALLNCTSEDACRAASVAMQRCTAQVVCPEIASDFNACVSATKSGKGNIEKTGEAYSVLVKCLELFEGDLRLAMEKMKK